MKNDKNIVHYNTESSTTPKPGWPRLPGVVGRFSPEECVIFHASFPQFLGFPVVDQLKTDGREVPLELPGTNLHEEVVPLVGDFQDFWPGEPIDSQSGIGSMSCNNFQGTPAYELTLSWQPTHDAAHHQSHKKADLIL